MSQTLIQPEISNPGVGSGRWMVVIYNNDHTPIDAVIEVLMRATGCGVDEAYMETWEAHNFGQAPCHFASQTECDTVASTISEIGVKTEVKPEWED